MRLGRIWRLTHGVLGRLIPIERRVSIMPKTCSERAHFPGHALDVEAALALQPLLATGAAIRCMELRLVHLCSSRRSIVMTTCSQRSPKCYEERQDQQFASFQRPHGEDLEDAARFVYICGCRKICKVGEFQSSDGAAEKRLFGMLTWIDSRFFNLPAKMNGKQRSTPKLNSNGNLSFMEECLYDFPSCCEVKSTLTVQMSCFFQWKLRWSILIYSDWSDLSSDHMWVTYVGEQPGLTDKSSLLVQVSATLDVNNTGVISAFHKIPAIYLVSKVLQILDAQIWVLRAI